MIGCLGIVFISFGTPLSESFPLLVCLPRQVSQLRERDFGNLRAES